ncbi:nucleotide-sugar transporter [Thozetella sp. PMI_491]|nr:nucleotide-sugar transporter [Thozetella sp. PMI_491]
MVLLDSPSNASSSGGRPSGLGMSMKQLSLVTLTFQNSALILIMHYSMIMPPDGDHRYFTSTAVFLNEVLKLAISLTFATYEASRSLANNTPATVLFEQIYNTVFSGDGWKLAIPATLYTLQNSLQYMALGNLDPVHFQILYQLKIITTAAFSVAMLGRTLNVKRWLALILLTFGVSIVCLPSSATEKPLVIHDTSDYFFPRSVHELGHLVSSDASNVAAELMKRTVDALEGLGLTKRSASYEGIQDDQDGGPAMNYGIGVAAVVVAAAISGLTGVYFEKMLKNSPTRVSVWTRNVQLSFYSLFPAFIFGVLWKDGAEIAKHGFFDGYNWVVWTAIVFQAVGGILASLCINYADNIAKNFATSISIVISTLLSVLYLDFKFSLTFVFGTVLVLLATFLYTGPDRKRGRPPPINIISYEDTHYDDTPSSIDDGKLRLDPLVGISTSRPPSPMLHHSRVPSARGKKFED